MLAVREAGVPRPRASTRWPCCADSTRPAGSRSWSRPKWCCWSTGCLSCGPISKQLEERLFDLLQRGGSFGIHVVLGDDPVERHPDDAAADDRHPVRVAAQRSVRLQHRPQAQRGPQDRPAGPGAHRREPVRPDRAAGAGRRRRRRRRRRPGRTRQPLGRRAGRARPPRRSGCCRPILDPELLPDALDEPDAVPFGLRQDTMEAALLELDGAGPAPARVRRLRVGQDHAAADRDPRVCWTATPPTSW